MYVRNFISSLCNQVVLFMPQQKLNVRAVSSQGAGKKKGKKIAKLEAKLPPYLRVMVDPFSAETEGAGRPDHNAAPTVVWPEKGAFTITPNADGNFWLQFTPALKGLYYAANFTAGATTITGLGGANDAPNYTEMVAAFSQYRPYALAIETEYIGAHDVAKGVIGSCPAAAFTNNVGANFTMLYDEPCYEETGVMEKLAVISRYVDNDAFLSPSAELYGGGVSPASVIHLIGTGLPPSTACIRVRWRFIAEYIAGPSNLMSRGAAMSVAQPSQLSAAANLMGKRAQVATGEDPIEKLKSHALNLIEVGGAINGLWNASKPLAGLISDFAMLVV